jgi:hypothetical protein
MAEQHHRSQPTFATKSAQNRRVDLPDQCPLLEGKADAGRVFFDFR